MTSRVILTAIGNDRPGLTQALADAVYRTGGNWLESHLSHLGSHYVGSVLVDIDEASMQALEEAVRNVGASGLHVSIVPAVDEPTYSHTPGAPLTIEVVGQDRPGIVREVSSALAGLAVNIEDLVTMTENGAWSGERLFRAHARVSLPSGVSSDQVSAALEAISGEIMVDFSVG